jgi:very-short-patch-repair endonuclease
MREENDRPEVALARIAEGQHGIVNAAQLKGVGIDKSALSRRVKAGRLHRVHRGVYAVGHRGLSLRGRWMAAVLACGEGAVLSHASAAALWELLRPIGGPIHVSIPSTTGRTKQRGIHLHRCPSLASIERIPPPSSTWQGGGRGEQLTLTACRDRIPVTTVPRTIHDLRGCVPAYLVRRAIRQAEHAGHRLDGVESDGTRSDLESAFLVLCRRHRLPAPQVNVKVGRWEVDFLWRAERLAVEIDSFAYHQGSIAFQNDRARDLDLRQRGYVVLRFSELQLEEEPTRVAADVARALAERAECF